MSAKKKTKAAKPEATKPEPKAEATKLSALAAATRVLEEAGQALDCKEIIAQMAAKKYWSSPAGKTPHCTLYSAMMREINTKGESSRFRKAARGKFQRCVPVQQA